MKELGKLLNSFMICCARQGMGVGENIVYPARICQNVLNWRY